MISAILIPAITGACLFVIGEVIRRRIGWSNEYSRKLIHVIHGLVVIGWSFWLPDSFIIGFELVFLACMVGFKYVVKHWPQFGWMYDVKRRSYGEFFYPVGVIAALSVTNDSWVFVVAVAQLAITDAVAALVGKTFGRSNEYKVFGSTKSVAGSTAFFIVAQVLFMTTILTTHAVPGLITAIMLLGASACLTLVENVSVYGSDNIFLPMTTALLLQAIL